jgi:hypothetical protein
MSVSVSGTEDATQLLSLLSSLQPALQSAGIAHLTPAASSKLSTAEQLAGHLREQLSSKDSELMQHYPKQRQAAADRIARTAQQQKLT